LLERIAYCAVFSAAALAGFIVLDVVDAAFCMVLAALIIWVTATDLERFEIPDLACAAILIGGILWTVQTWGINEFVLLDTIARVAIASGFLYVLRAAYRIFRNVDGLGLGDVKLLGAGAAWISWPYMVFVLLIASVSALVLVAARSLLRGEALKGDIVVPFGAFLAPAIWIAWFVQVAASF
jgi:leader peptidase (prepilin peptidase)/N-methyltransferase